jgi:hypothetical protein
VPLPAEILDPGFPLEQWLDEVYGDDPAGWFEVYSAVMRTPVPSPAVWPGDDGG